MNDEQDTPREARRMLSLRGDAKHKADDTPKARPSEPPHPPANAGREEEAQSGRPESRLHLRNPHAGEEAQPEPRLPDPLRAAERVRRGRRFAAGLLIVAILAGSLAVLCLVDLGPAVSAEEWETAGQLLERVSQNPADTAAVAGLQALIRRIPDDPGTHETRCALIAVYVLGRLNADVSPEAKQLLDHARTHCADSITAAYLASDKLSGVCPACADDPGPPCTACQGTGTCPRCKGSGKDPAVKGPLADSRGQKQKVGKDIKPTAVPRDCALCDGTRRCPRCGGTGRAAKGCPSCKGTGTRLDTTRIAAALESAIAYARSAIAVKSAAVEGQNALLSLQRALRKAVGLSREPEGRNAYSDYF
jgi:hypothetical protein